MNPLSFQCHLYQYNLVLVQLYFFFFFFQLNRDFFVKIRKIKQVNISERTLLDFISYIFVSLALSKKL